MTRVHYTIRDVAPDRSLPLTGVVGTQDHGETSCPALCSALRTDTSTSIVGSEWSGVDSGPNQALDLGPPAES